MADPDDKYLEMNDHWIEVNIDWKEIVEEDCPDFELCGRKIEYTRSSDRSAGQKVLDHWLYLSMRTLNKLKKKIDSVDETKYPTWTEEAKASVYRNTVVKCLTMTAMESGNHHVGGKSVIGQYLMGHFIAVKNTETGEIEYYLVKWDEDTINAVKNLCRRDLLGVLNDALYPANYDGKKNYDFYDQKKHNPKNFPTTFIERDFYYPGMEEYNTITYPVDEKHFNAFIKGLFRVIDTYLGDIQKSIWEQEKINEEKMAKASKEKSERIQREMKKNPKLYNRNNNSGCTNKHCYTSITRSVNYTYDATTGRFYDKV